MSTTRRQNLRAREFNLVPSPFTELDVLNEGRAFMPNQSNMDLLAEPIVWLRSRFPQMKSPNICTLKSSVPADIFATFTALKSVLILCSAILSYYCSWTLHWCRRKSPQKSLHDTKFRVGSRFAYVVQQFVGTNFLSIVGLFDNLRIFLPENTWSDTSHILRIYFSGSEISIRLMSNQTYDTKKK